MSTATWLALGFMALGYGIGWLHGYSKGFFAGQHEWESWPLADRHQRDDLEDWAKR